MVKGIKNLVKWFKVIWTDRDHDWAYILIILRHKLKYVKLDLEKNEDSCSKDIGKAIEYIDIILEESDDESITTNLEKLSSLLNKKLVYWWRM
jgi:ribosome-binding factor A